jgi:hypothetical protein
MHNAPVCVRLTGRTEDHRFMTLCIPKAVLGGEWAQLFSGDSTGCRSLKPPYELTGTMLPCVAECCVLSAMHSNGEASKLQTR